MTEDLMTKRIIQPQIIQPMGKKMKEIHIIADDKGVFQVFPWNMDPATGGKVPMHPAEMLLILMKISLDTAAAITNQGGARIGPIPEGSGDDGKTAGGDHN